MGESEWQERNGHTLFEVLHLFPASIYFCNRCRRTIQDLSWTECKR